MRLAGVVLVAALVSGSSYGCSGSNDGPDRAAPGAHDGGRDVGADAAVGKPKPAAEVSCSERYELLADLAIDLETRLTWTRFVSVDALTHADAATRCATRGMRLPTRPELASIMLAEEPAGRDCRLPCVFEGQRCATLICDTPIPGSQDHWGVTFLAGGLVSVPAAQPSGYVCVR